MDRVDLSDGQVILGSDLPFDEPDDPALSIGRALAEEPCPVLDALAERQAFCLVGCEQGTVGGDPAVVVNRGGRAGVVESGGTEGGRLGHRRHATPSLGQSGIGIRHKL
jgi:hypothetical protein